MAMQNKVNATVAYPEGEAMQQRVTARQRRGLIWQSIFLVSTLIGILALVALLYNIINSAFGYVAVQNKVDPTALVLALAEEKVLAAPNLVSSEDDNVLAEGVLADPNAIGFFGYAYLQEHADKLRAVTINGVTPSSESLTAGNYPLARPLFIYTDPKTLAAKPQVAAFVHYYLANVNQQISEVGYFPVTSEILSAAVAKLPGAPSGAIPNEAITIAGSSTVFPLTQRLASGFRTSGYTGQLTVDSTGTKAGLVAFCADGKLDIVDASRAINQAELEACRAAGREPLELRVGTDALAVVVSQQNSFLQNVTIEQLRKIFAGGTEAIQSWHQVDPAWPDAPIKRFIPGKDSGTLDFFVEAVLPGQLATLSKAELTTILQANVSKGLLRRFEKDQSFAERTQENVYALVLERVVERKVVKSWTLSESLLQRNSIAATVATIANGELNFHSWLNRSFLTSSQSADPELAGVRSAILGSLWVILITLLFALPIGVGAAIYLEEYAKDNWINRLIATNISNLAGVPSIIYGMLGLAIFVRLLEPLTSGAFFGLVDATTANGRTILSAGLTLALLVLPLIIINAQEAIRAVPRSLRDAGYGLGATQWQIIWHHVLPSALPGILTGNILAISRAIGETAPLVVVGASTFVAIDPSGPFSKFTSLPVQIYQWTSRPQDEFRNIAAAAILVLLVLLLSLNASAVILRNRFGQRV